MGGYEPATLVVPVNVIMLVGAKRTFKDDWANAARLVANVMTIAPTDELAWRPIPSLPFLSEDPSDSRVLQLLRPAVLSRRVAGPYYDWETSRRMINAVDYLERNHGFIDVMHGHFFASCGSLPRVHQKRRVPFVVTEHSTKLSGNPYKSTSSRGLRSAARVYSDAYEVICVSEHLRQALIDLHLTNHATVVPNPIDTNLFTYSGKHEKSDTINCLNVGRLARVKGHDVLLRAFELAFKKDLRLRLSIVGSGPMQEELLSLRRELRLERSVQFLGRKTREEIATALALTDFLVLSSRFETFGIPVVEALASGVPVVVPKIGPILEIVTPDDGLTVTANDPRALSEGILQMAKQYDAFDREAIASRARRRFSLESVSSRLLEVYERATA